MTENFSLLNNKDNIRRARYLKIEHDPSTGAFDFCSEFIPNAARRRAGGKLDLGPLFYQSGEKIFAPYFPRLNIISELPGAHEAKVSSTGNYICKKNEEIWCRNGFTRSD